MFSLLTHIPIRSHHKGVGDVFNKRVLTNPLGHVKDTIKTTAHKPLYGLAMSGGAGKGLAPDVVKGYAKATIDPANSGYSYRRDKGATAKPTVLGAGNQPANTAEAQRAKRKTILGGIQP